MKLVSEEFTPWRRHRRDIKRNVTVFAPVYRIVDADTGRVMDDNHGFGFAGTDGRNRALSRWKSYVKTSRFAVLEWLNAHSAEGALLFELTFDSELGRFGNETPAYDVLMDALASLRLEAPVRVETLYDMLLKLMDMYVDDDICNDSSLSGAYRIGRARAICEAGNRQIEARMATLS